VVEYEMAGVGERLVEEYEVAGVGCAVTAATCCGAPWLHAGHVDRFAKVARRNVELLAAEIRRGHDVVVAEPTCRGVIVRGYPDHVPTADASLVATHTFDAAEYLHVPPNGAQGAEDGTE
jgi:Fe-S oxidoreductase